jgi:hypothetical protein
VLHEAASRANTRIIRQLVTRFGGDLGAQDDFGDTPLHVACANGRAPVVAALVDLGADTRVVNNSSETPLHAAARAGAAGVVRYLVGIGRGNGGNGAGGSGGGSGGIAGQDSASPQRQDAGKSASRRATGSKRSTLNPNDASTATVGNKPNTKRASVSAATGQSAAQAALAQENGTRLTAPCPPFFFSSSSFFFFLHSFKHLFAPYCTHLNTSIAGSVAVARPPLRLDAVDRRGLTPLHHAAAHSNRELVRVLLSAGCDASLIDADGRTPRAVAEAVGYMEIAAILAQAESSAPASPA